MKKEMENAKVTFSSIKNLINMENSKKVEGNIRGRNKHIQLSTPPI